MTAGRTADTLQYVVEELRGTPGLVDRLGGDPKRIYPGTPSEAKPFDVAVAISATYAGGEHRGRGERLRFLVQASVVATHDWRDANSSLEQHRILDEIGDVLGTSRMAGLVPLGNAGGASELEVMEDHRVVLPARWRFQRTLQNHSK